MRFIKEFTAPSVEPVLLADLKTHLRIDSSAENTLLENLIKEAREKIESMTGRALITQVHDLFLDGFPSRAIKIPLPPCISIDEVFSTDKDGSESTVATSIYWAITDNEPAIISLKSGQIWPTDLRSVVSVRIRFTAGYGTAGSDVPEALRNAIRERAALHWINRKGQVPRADLDKTLNSILRYREIVF